MVSIHDLCWSYFYSVKLYHIGLCGHFYFTQEEYSQWNCNICCFQGNSNASPVPVVPPSLLGIGGFVPSAQIAGMHSYMMHPQGVPPSLASPNSAVPQFGSFQSQSTIQPNMQWPNQQVHNTV